MSCLKGQSCGLAFEGFFDRPKGLKDMAVNGNHKPQREA